MSINTLKQFADFFDPNRDIILIHDLIHHIEDLYYENPMRFEDIRKLLKQEFQGNGSSKRHGLIKFLHHEEKVHFYKELFIVNQHYKTQYFIPIHYTSENELCLTDKLHRKLLTSNGFIIYGPSGCGKSMLARQLAVELIDSVFPVILEAKYYDRNLDELFYKQISMFGFQSVDEFFNCAVESGQQGLFIIDGLNECPIELRSKLLLETKKAMGDWNFKLIITTQQRTEPELKEMPVSSIEIPYPSDEIKMAIALAYSQHMNKKKLIPIINIVSSALEAKIAGEVEDISANTNNRFTLFESFIKKKLEDNYLGGFFLLSLIAQMMSEKITFSLLIRDVETLLLQHSLSSELYKNCLKSGILEERANKISFGHEMFFNFFVAEGVARFVSNANEVLEALNAPKNTDKKLLIIGAIADQQLLDKILYGLTDSDLFCSLLEGEGGEFCKQWIEQRLQQLLTRVATEVYNCQFEFAETLTHFQCCKDGLENWSNNDLAIILTIPSKLINGELLNEMLDLTDVLDDVCAKSIRQHWEEGEKRGIGARSAIFSTVLLGSSKEQLAITRIISLLQSGFFHFRNKNSISPEQLKNSIEGRDLKPAQLYFLLSLFRYDDRLRVLYPTALEMLKRWRYIPYPLLTEILLQICHLFENEEQRKELANIIHTIHSETQNIWLSTTIFDALFAIGELDEDANNYISVVNNEIATLLNTPDDQNACQNAAGIYDRQYDHPYQSAYYTAINNLTGTRKALFFEMTLKGMHLSLFSTWLIFEAYQIIGATAMQHLIRWTENPFNDVGVSLPDDALDVFLVVHLLLGHENYSLPQRNNSTDKIENSVRALAEIFYWESRTNIDNTDKQHQQERLSEVLFHPENIYTVETIWQSEFRLSQQNYLQRLGRDVIGLFESNFRERIVDACGRSLTNLDWQKSIRKFGYQDNEVNLHAIFLIERLGTVVDVDILRSLTNNDLYGRSAVEAIKKMGG